MAVTLKLKKLVDVLLGVRWKMNKWEKDFLGNMEKACKRDWEISSKRGVKLQALADKYLEDDSGFTTESTSMAFGRITAERVSDGWVITLGDYVIGEPVTRVEAEKIAPWLDESWERLEDLILTKQTSPRKPVKVSYGKEEELQAVKPNKQEEEDWTV